MARGSLRALFGRPSAREPVAPPGRPPEAPRSSFREAETNKLLEDEWIAVDFETASARGTPCQMACVRVRDGREVDRFSTFVFQPAARFSPYNVALHGITADMVRRAPTWPDVHAHLLSFADGLPLVAHYAAFDMGVLREACDSSELDWPTLRYACTRSVARLVWPGQQSYSLAALCYQLGLVSDDEKHHEALHDARLAARLLVRAIEVEGADGLLDLLTAIHVRVGEIRPDGWDGCEARRTSAKRALAFTPNPDADPEGPFYGQVVAFTGELALVRAQAQRLVAELGGQPANGVTRQTDFLVCGYQDLVKLATGQAKSAKLRKAEDLHAAGQPLEIITEADFFKMLDHEASLQ
jgi:DNA polymerase III epsilon subunit-like protein